MPFPVLFSPSISWHISFTSNTVQSVIEDKSDGSTKQKELATATVKTYLVPIPPLMEQDRIISKIKQLASIMSRTNNRIIAVAQIVFLFG